MKRFFVRLIHGQCFERAANLQIVYSTDQKKPNRERVCERERNGYRTGMRTGTGRLQNGYRMEMERERNGYGTDTEIYRYGYRTVTDQIKVLCEQIRELSNRIKIFFGSYV